MVRAVLETVIVGAVFATTAFFTIAEQATLSIDGETKVWDRPDIASQQRRPVDVLKRGVSVPVTRCIDAKTDFNYEIELPDGQTGYVDVGTYRLHTSAWRPGSRLVYNCH